MTDRVAIVTGASRGIGRASAERLAAEGLAVIVGYAGNAELAADVVGGIEARGGRAVAVQADVADEQQVAAMFAVAIEQFGGVDVVVNAAGSMTLSPLADFALDDFDAMVRTNLRGTFVVDQFAARQVRSGGAIINFSTTQVRTRMPSYSAYIATKSAVESIGLVLARELAGRDITVNSIAPGPTATDMFLDGKDDALIERLANMNPMQRLGTPQDLADVVAFLAGPGRWVNGQVLYANGGMA